MTTPESYSRAQVALHWITVMLIAGQYLLHDGIEAAWHARLDGSLPNAPFPNPHVVVGMLVLLPGSLGWKRPQTRTKSRPNSCWA